MQDWLLDHGWRIALVVVLALTVMWLVRRTLPRAIRMTVSSDRFVDVSDSIALDEQRKRAETLSRVLVRVLDIVAVFVAVLLVLGELEIPLGPLLASAGIVGVALGFGAQSLVRDTLAGMFILIENQYRAGDVVTVAGVSGTVEEVGLRRTVLRDIDGIVHSVSNGEIVISSNMTRGWSRVNLNVSVGYDQDLDRARAVIDRVGAELAADPDWATLILEPPKVLRVDAFEESGIALKVLATTKPMKQWEVAGELRQRIKVAFDAEGIEIPFPHRTVVMRREDA
ncbi:MAG: mechanosensitive ion channel family protein [Thermoleophilia bacterium]|nr:mechanosensitive ion channel family protein [Thermoleophilia bacterium]